VVAKGLDADLGGAFAQLLDRAVLVALALAAPAADFLAARLRVGDARRPLLAIALLAQLFVARAPGGSADQRQREAVVALGPDRLDRRRLDPGAGGDQAAGAAAVQRPGEVVRRVDLVGVDEGEVERPGPLGLEGDQPPALRQRPRQPDRAVAAQRAELVDLAPPPSAIAPVYQHRRPRPASADSTQLRLRSPGALAEWLRSGLQSRLHRFDSGRRLPCKSAVFGSVEPLAAGFVGPAESG
jgi:hypothetical protein